MSSHAHTSDPNSPEVYVQYEDIGQQQETYIVGMWSFMVTEIMFFAPLFFVYFLYRSNYQPDFFAVSAELDWKLGGLNTVILLLSSFTMALAVHYSQKGKVKEQLISLGATVVCAFGFLVVKYFEYSHKFHKGYIPDNDFHLHYHGAANPEVARIIYSMYFCMTGIHGIHIVVGILLIGTLMIMTHRKSKHITDYIPTELIGLYWHFVDLVWIFLYPLFYLIPR